MTQCIRTKQGEDLIGHVTENIGGNYTIEKPCMIMMMQNQNGSINIGLAPFLPFALKPLFTFKKEDVQLVFEPSRELVAEYTRITSNIILPPDPATGLKLM